MRRSSRGRRAYKSLLKKLATGGDLWDDSNKKVKDLCESLRESIRDKNLEKLELELEL